MIRQVDTWVLTAEWFDGDSLRHGHAFFSTKRDAEAVGKRLAAKHGDPDHEFEYLVEKAAPWPSSQAQSAPFSDPPTIGLMVSSIEKEWDI